MLHFVALLTFRLDQLTKMSKKSYKLQHIISNDVDGKQRDSFSVPQISISQANGKLPVNTVPERGTYSKSIQSLLLCISMSVGLGNVWRFPNIAYNNGGGAFLIPYLLLLVIIGRPLYYMELILGQFSSQGPIKVWKCVPAFKGIGYAQVISVSFVVIFYNYLMALSLFYMFASMQSCLPWACNENGTIADESFQNTSFCANGSSLSECFWINEVLEQTHGADEFKSISYKLVLCLLLTWIIVYVAVVQGVDSLGRMSYFTAFFPYVVLVALLIVACLEEGAGTGIKHLFYPQIDRLLDIKVWYKACEQSFFSLAIGYGNIVMIASYNKFDNNVNRDAIIISVMDTITNILAGCVVFAVLGSLSHKLKKDISNVVVGEEELGLAFIAYPQALANIKYVPQLWSVLFFFMLFTLGIGSSMSQIETILTVFKDRFPSLREKKWLLSLCICIMFFILGLPLTTNVGQTILLLLNNYGVGAAVFLYATLEVIGIMWIYGVQNFCQDMAFMLKKPVGIFWKITWTFTAPIALLVLFIYGTIADQMSEKKNAPEWSKTVGWFLAVFALIQIPIWFCIIVYRDPHRGIWQKLRHSLTPTADWGPSDPGNKADWIAMKKPGLKFVDSVDISSSIPPMYENSVFREDVF